VPITYQLPASEKPDHTYSDNSLPNCNLLCDSQNNTLIKSKIRIQSGNIREEQLDNGGQGSGDHGKWSWDCGGDEFLGVGEDEVDAAESHDGVEVEEVKAVGEGDFGRWGGHGDSRRCGFKMKGLKLRDLEGWGELGMTGLLSDRTGNTEG